MTAKATFAGASDEREIAEAWIKEQRTWDAKTPWDRHSAIAILGDLVHSDPEKAWRIMQIVWRLDSKDDNLGILAAGPIEDILAARGHQFIDRVETLARQEPIFKKMLGGLWQNAIPDDVWDRLKAVAGPPF
jgi:hypothetical protein